MPGVRLVGPHVARRWLQQHGTLDNLLAHAQDLPKGKRRGNLLKFRYQALLSRQMVQLHADVPLEWDWPHWRLRQYGPKEIEKLCCQFGFRELARRLLALSGVAEEATSWDAFLDNT